MNKSAKVSPKSTFASRGVTAFDIILLVAGLVTVNGNNEASGAWFLHDQGRVDLSERRFGRIQAPSLLGGIKKSRCPIYWRDDISPIYWRSSVIQDLRSCTWTLSSGRAESEMLLRVGRLEVGEVGFQGSWT